MDGFVYIVMLDAPLGNLRHSAMFYVGWTRNLSRRLAHHRNGTGAAFLRAAVALGIGFRVVYSAPGTRADERAIKRQKNTRRFLQRRGIQL